MADEIDRANDLTELMLTEARSKRKPESKATGHCLYCNEKLGKDERFCDDWCRDDWEDEQRVKKIMGY